MPVPDFQTLMLPALRAIADEGTITSAELRNRVASALSLSPDDISEMLPSGGQSVLVNRVAWAVVHLQRAGLVEKVKSGIYRITSKGIEISSDPPHTLDIKYLETLPVYRETGNAQVNEIVEDRKNYSNTLQSQQAGSLTPQEAIERAAVSLEDQLASALLDRVRRLSPAAFERLIVDLLVAMGYGGGRAELAQQTKLTNDGGIDGMIKEDPLGLDLVVMQAKRYTPPGTVGRPELQSFAGSLDGNKATKGIFVTTSTFTTGAAEFARSIQKRLVLINGEELARLMIRYDVGVRVTQTFAIKDIDENVFEEG